MVEPLIKQFMSRGEEFFGELSNRLLANEAFVDVLKKGLAAKEAVDKQVAQAMKRMNVATRKDINKLEARLAALEAELEAMKAAPQKAAAPRRRTQAARGA